MKNDKKINDKKQQLEKDRTKEEAAADKAKPRCFICGKYTDKKTSPQCFGHGGGGGGSSGGGSEEKAGKDDATLSSAKSSGGSDTGSKAELKATNVRSNIATKPQLDLTVKDIKFNPKIISELLSKKILVIDNDKEKGMLTIKLLLDPNSLSQEQRNELKKFMNAILNELNEFKKEKNITANCYTIQKDKDGNIMALSIALPTPTLYDAFIQRLANKNLLPIQNIEQEKNKKVAYPQDGNHFNPSPLSTRPTPENKNIAEEEAQNTGKKKSHIKPKSPADGLKPKGWE
jgi:hypothetical protein